MPAVRDPLDVVGLHVGVIEVASDDARELLTQPFGGPLVGTSCADGCGEHVSGQVHIPDNVIGLRIDYRRDGPGGQQSGPGEQVRPGLRPP